MLLERRPRVQRVQRHRDSRRSRRPGPYTGPDESEVIDVGRAEPSRLQQLLNEPRPDEPAHRIAILAFVYDASEAMRALPLGRGQIEYSQFANETEKTREITRLQAFFNDRNCFLRHATDFPASDFDIRNPSGRFAQYFNGALTGSENTFNNVGRTLRWAARALAVRAGRMEAGVRRVDRNDGPHHQAPLVVPADIFDLRALVWRNVRCPRSGPVPPSANGLAP